jgi:hypothetical protein
MRAYFELNDKGTCNRFTLVKGTQKTHTFINEGKGGSKLRFDGPQAEFDLLMRDIYSVISPALRTKAIFVYVEQPNLSELQEHITFLTNQNAALEAQLAEAQTVTHPFPLGTPPLSKPAKAAKIPKGRAQPDVGLPVGPGAPFVAKKPVTLTVTPAKALTPAEATKAKRKATWARKKAEAEALKAKKPGKQPAHA